MKVLLEINGLTKTGPKDEVLARCVEAVVYGVIPKCPKCDGALHFAAGAAGRPCIDTYCHAHLDIHYNL